MVDLVRAAKRGEAASLLAKMMKAGEFVRVPELTRLVGLSQDPHHHPEGCVWTHTLEVVQRAPAHLVWAALLHDVGKGVTATPYQTWNKFPGHAEAGEEIAREILLRWGLDSEAERVGVLTRLHMRPLSMAAGEVSEKTRRRLAAEAGPFWQDLEALCRADAGQRDRGLDQVFAPLPPLEKTTPLVTGADLLERGYTPGKALGLELQRLLQLQAQGLNRDDLLAQITPEG